MGYLSEGLEPTDPLGMPNLKGLGPVNSNTINPFVTEDWARRLLRVTARSTTLTRGLTDKGTGTGRMGRQPRLWLESRLTLMG